MAVVLCESLGRRLGTLGVLMLGLVLAQRPAGAIGSKPPSGFVPGEWRITAVTTGALVGTTSTTSDVCLHLAGAAGPGHDLAQLGVPGPAGKVRNILTEQGDNTILQSQFSTLSAPPTGGPSEVESYNGREVYTRDAQHHAVMHGTGRLTYAKQGKVLMQETITEQGRWLSASCMAQPPAAVTKTLAPSSNLQALLASMAKLDHQEKQNDVKTQPAIAAEERKLAEQKKLAPLEHEEMQAIQDRDTTKFLKLQAQIKAIQHGAP